MNFELLHLHKFSAFSPSGEAYKNKIEIRRKFGAAARETGRLAKDPSIREKYTKKLKPCQNVINLIVCSKLKGD